MKPLFKPIPMILFVFSSWITWVCASLLTWDEAGNLIARSYSIWGDWSAHLTFMSAFQERGISWVSGSNPVFSGMPFQYPFLSHILTLVLAKITFMSLISATYWSSLFLIFMLPFLLYRFFRALGLKEVASLFSVLVFLMIGGLQWMDSGLNPGEPLTNQFDRGSLFTQFILFEFFPQRAFLFGLTSYALLFTAFLKKKTWNPRSLFLYSLGFSLLTLLHVHSWIAMGAFLIGLFFFPLNPSLSRKTLFKVGASTLFVSFGFLYFLLFRSKGSGFQSSWEWIWPGWAQNSKANLQAAHDMNLFLFWIYNTGLFLPLASIGLYLERKNPSLRGAWFSGVLLFSVALTLNLQPYFYDNLKVFTYAFLFLAPFAGIALDELRTSRFLPKGFGIGVALILLGAQTTSAARDLWSFQEGMQNALFFSREELELVDLFKGLRTSADDLVLINPRHNHWLPCLSGNPVFMGYPGWLWSWGIQYSSREQEVHEILVGGQNAQVIIRNAKLKYAVLNLNETFNGQTINFGYFDSHFEKVLDRYGWRIYSLTSELKSPSSSVR